MFIVGDRAGGDESVLTKNKLILKQNNVPLTGRRYQTYSAHLTTVFGSWKTDG